MSIPEDRFGCCPIRDAGNEEVSEGEDDKQRSLLRVCERVMLERGIYKQYTQYVVKHLCPLELQVKTLYLTRDGRCERFQISLMIYSMSCTLQGNLHVPQQCGQTYCLSCMSSEFYIVVQ